MLLGPDLSKNTRIVFLALVQLLVNFTGTVLR